MHQIDQIAQQIQDCLFVELEASGRHVHLSQDDAISLFGHLPTEHKPLSQPGQYLCKERVTLVGSKGTIPNVAVLGPCRGESQVELSKTDGMILGILPPVRLSGHIQNTPSITLESPRTKVHLPHGVIVAQRHLHMTPKSAQQYGVQDGDVVDVSCLTARPIVLRKVSVRVSPQFQTRLHMDYDEANACGFVQGDLGRIVYDYGKH